MAKRKNSKAMQSIVSKHCPSINNAKSSPTDRKTHAAYWLKRIYRNTYTRNGKKHFVGKWAVKFQLDGTRQTFSLKACSLPEAAEEAARLYRHIKSQRTKPLKQVGAGGASPGFSKEYWKRRLTFRPYPAKPNRETMPELAVSIEHAGISHYFPLGTPNEAEAVAKASEIHGTIVANGWKAANRLYKRELSLALRWLDNPLAWTYTTFHTWNETPTKGLANEIGIVRNIALVEPDAGVRTSIMASLSSEPGYSCRFCYSRFSEALLEVARQPIDLVLVNGMLREESTNVRLLDLKRCGRPVVGLFYSIYEDADQLFKSTPGGSFGYMLKRTVLSKILDPIAGATGALTYDLMAKCVRDYFQRLICALPSGPSTLDMARLTAREREILSLLAKGHVTKEISDALRISEWTVNGHVKSLLDKLNVHSRTEAVVKYLEQ